MRLSGDFFADPLLFVAAGDSLVQRLLVDRYHSKDQEATPATASATGTAPAEKPAALFASVAHRFHFLEPPTSQAGEVLKSFGFSDDGYGTPGTVAAAAAGSASEGSPSGQSTAGAGASRISEYVVKDVPPLGGTLVLFDSVALPHEVLATVGRERFACSGWFHEDQQPEHPDTRAA